MAFAHISISSICSTIGSAAVATGMGNTLGNKGGVGISMKIGKTKFVFVNAHLAAHQNAVKQRNDDYKKIAIEIPNLLLRNEMKTNTKLMAKSSKASVTKKKINRFSANPSPARLSERGIENNEINTGGSSNGSYDAAVYTALNADSLNSNGAQGPQNILTPLDTSRISLPDSTSNGGLSSNVGLAPNSGLASNVGLAPNSGLSSSSIALEFHDCADRVIFMGDLNYRVRGNRYVRSIEVTLFHHYFSTFSIIMNIFVSIATLIIIILYILLELFSFSNYFLF